MGVSKKLSPTATLECVAQNCPRRITILQLPATRETACDGLISPCVRSVCSRSVAVGLIGLDHSVGHFRPLSITRQRHWLAYHFIAMRHEDLCQVFLQLLPLQSIAFQLLINSFYFNTLQEKEKNQILVHIIQFNLDLKST